MKGIPSGMDRLKITRPTVVVMSSCLTGWAGHSNTSCSDRFLGSFLCQASVSTTSPVKRSWMMAWVSTTLAMWAAMTSSTLPNTMPSPLRPFRFLVR